MGVLALVNIDAAIHEWAANVGWPTEEFLRLVLAMVAGGLVGLEREVRGRQAGFRTNLLVCVGSALVMLVSVQVAEQPWRESPGFNINVDPARIAYGVMTGVGFLGAGTIIQQRGNVRGLTTAAGLWAIAAVGLACGLGLYTLAAISSLMILAALWLLQFLEGVMPKVHYRSVIVRVPWRSDCVAEAVARFEAAGIQVIDANFQRTADLASADITLYVAFMSKKRFYQFERRIEEQTPWQLLSVRT